MDDGNKTIDLSAMMNPTSASSSTHSLQVSPKLYCKNDEAEASEPTIGCKRRLRPLNTNMDPNKLRRIQSNRASAYKARLKQSQHINQMEWKAKALEAQIAMLSHQTGFYQKQHEMLLVDRDSLKRKISDYASIKYQKEAEIEGNKVRLRQLKLMFFKQREITQEQAQYKGRMVSYGDTNNPGSNNFAAQIGSNTGEVNSKLSEIKVKPGKKAEGRTWMPTPGVFKMAPTLTLSMGYCSKPQPKVNSKSKDPLSLSLGING